MLVQLVWIGDTRLVQGLSSVNESPKGRMIRLSDDIRRNAIPNSIPPSGDLNRNSTTRFESLGDEGAGTFLELDKPLTGFTSPDTALVTMFVFEFLRFSSMGSKS